MRSRFVMMIGMVVAAMAMVELTFAEEKKMMKPVNPEVVMETSEGGITIQLWADKSPETVRNFLRYADEKFYDDIIFHRVISNFMIQGGGFCADMKRKDSHQPIKNEATAELKNDRGTIAMARTRDIHSATCQFFINLKDNDFLNHSDNTPRGFGYAVFGKVIKGMEVVDRIGKVQTTTSGPYRDVPAKPVIIKSVKRLGSN
jgi:cyclophilin family peptidyl-prolyl cis-trans isomerase